MRIAVLVIGLVVMLVLGMQSCAVTVGGSFLEEFEQGREARQAAEATTGAGAIGLLAALVFAVAAGFALAKPKVAMILFLVAGFFTLIGATAGDFPDLWIWTFVALALAVMSYFGIREQRRKALKEAPAPITSGPAAGWYRDPEGTGQRWWDGQRWTEHQHSG